MSFDDEGNDRSWENREVTDYWYEHYCDVLCILCDNSGFIKPDVPCICPNGQCIRAALEAK